MRLFTGIAIPQVITERLNTVVESLRAGNTGAGNTGEDAALRWSPLTNLHITTKFIGVWAQDRLEELKQALALVPIPGNLTIEVAGFGFYPNPNHAKVLFAGVGAPGLDRVHAATEDALEPLGCAREGRPFSPHLTLARIRRQDIHELRQRIAELNDPDFGFFVAREFHLYLSKPGPLGSVYNSLAVFRSKREAIVC